MNLLGGSRLCSEGSPKLWVPTDPSSISALIIIKEWFGRDLKDHLVPGTPLALPGCCKPHPTIPCMGSPCFGFHPIHPHLIWRCSGSSPSPRASSMDLSCCSPQLHTCTATGTSPLPQVLGEAGLLLFPISLTPARLGLSPKPCRAAHGGMGWLSLPAALVHKLSLIDPAEQIALPRHSPAPTGFCPLPGHPC